MGCGELIVKLFLEFRRLPPASLVEVHATDAGAPVDLPAWCRLTGNALLSGPAGEDGAYYYIRKPEQQ